MRIPTLKVKRLKSDCCGMIEGKVYPATIECGYVFCLLPNGTWTSSHWMGNNVWFEVVESEK